MCVERCALMTARSGQDEAVGDRTAADLECGLAMLAYIAPARPLRLARSLCCAMWSAARAGCGGCGLASSWGDPGRGGVVNGRRPGRRCGCFVCCVYFV
ncbi:hypothetical protein FXW78_18565 [Rhodococcus opacus]|nr:hypothetical protein [Rhodococcus opacus]